jgi:predicted membrane metal-binding protein
MRKDRTALTYYSTRSCCLTPFRSRHLSVSSLELISRPNLAEKFAIIGLQTMCFAIIGFQTWTSLNRPLKRCDFAIIGFFCPFNHFLN